MYCHHNGIGFVICIYVYRSLPPPNLFNRYSTHNAVANTTSADSEECTVYFRLIPFEFDKDNDRHMRVVAAASNLRARNYSIKEEDLHTSRYSCI